MKDEKNVGHLQDISKVTVYFGAIKGIKKKIKEGIKIKERI